MKEILFFNISLMQLVQYQGLVEQLIYLSHTWLDNFYAVSIVS